MAEQWMIKGRGAWLARITGTDPRFGLARDFVARADGYGRTVNVELEDGLYEENEISKRGGVASRSFFRIANGKLAGGLSEAQVREALR